VLVGIVRNIVWSVSDNAEERIKEAEMEEKERKNLS